MEILNLHMKNIHLESDHERLDRVTDTVKSSLNEESLQRSTSKKEQDSHVKSQIFDCSEFGKIFPTREDMNIHNKKFHDEKVFCHEETSGNVCDLCDKVFANITQK